MSQAIEPKDKPLGRKVAILVADGVDAASVTPLVEALKAQGAVPELLAPVDGAVTAADGTPLPVDRAIVTVASVLYDAVVVPDGTAAAELICHDGYAVHFVAEAYKHAKPVAFHRGGCDGAYRGEPAGGGCGGGGGGAHFRRGRAGEDFLGQLVTAVAAHRFFERPVDAVPA